jgi:YetA-like protein
LKRKDIAPWIAKLNVLNGRRMRKKRTSHRRAIGDDGTPVGCLRPLIKSGELDQARVRPAIHVGTNNRTFGSCLLLPGFLLIQILAGCAGVAGQQTQQPSTNGPVANLSPSVLSFGNETMGVPSSPQNLTLQNTGATALTISSIAITGTNSGDFAETNTCPASSSSTLAAGSSCSISIVFTPSTTAGETAAVRVSDNAAGSPQSVSIGGIGTSSGSGGSPAPTQLPVGLTVQEALYSGVAGVTRSQDPVTVGIPISDPNQITNVSQLGLNGASAGQFRVLGRWPSGNIKWVLVDTLADVTAGGQNTSIVLTTGSGNFGGGNLATDNGSSISINTGPATFNIKKANFDLIDQAVVNGRALVASGTSTGLAVEGPPPGSTVCPCSTLYTSSNDPNSQAVIEENGPVRTVIKATGRFLDSSGDAYMRYTVRLHFYQGLDRVKAVVLLQNADYGASNSFASAFKEFTSFEARLTPALGSSRSFSFGTSGSPVSGSFAGSENAYLYQAYSNNMEDCGWIDPDSTPRLYPYIARTLLTNNVCLSTWSYQQEGYKVVHSSTVLATGTRSQYPEGWADLTDSTGAGIMVGVYEMAAYWPKSLQFVSGGSEIRVGIWPDQSLYMSGGQQYVQSWPQYSEHTLVLSFHSAALSTPSSEFAKFQYPLIARAPTGYYNATNVFMYPIIDPTEENNYYKSLGLWCCLADYAGPHIYRTYGWATPGGGNQAEMRWADLVLWLQRGYTARYLNTSHFYQMQAEMSFPRSDYNGANPFNWRDSDMASAVDTQGFPSNIATVNNNVNCDVGTAICNRNWIDTQHAHWYGMTDYYFLTGDENVDDAIRAGVTDTYGNPNVGYVVNGDYWAARDVGIALMSDARLNVFYSAIGDSTDAANALQAADTVLSNQVYPDYELSGYGTAPQGTSRTRGVQITLANSTTGTDGPFAKPFQLGILSEGIWEVLKTQGPSWPQYNQTFDLAYGIAHWTLTEAWRTNGTAVGCSSNTGPAYQINLTVTNNPLPPSCSQTVWFNFYNEAKYIGPGGDWKDKFNQYLAHLDGTGNTYAEDELIFPAAVISEILHPQASNLVTVPVTVTNLGGGSYSLSWTVPTSAISYRIKYANKTIVDWIGFDPVNNAFIGDPATTWAWFASTDVSNPPAPAAAGTTQSFTVTGLDASQTWNFAVKAYVQ